MIKRSVEEIRQRLVEELAKELELAPGEISPTEPFDRYGLDSMAAVNLTLSMETLLGRELSPSLPFKYRSIEALASHLGKLN